MINEAMGKSYLFISLISIFLIVSFATSADNKTTNKGSIIVEIEDFKHSKGVLRSHIYNFETKEYFPVKTDFCLMRDTALIKDNKSLIIYDDLPFGVYAITVHHDENANGSMDTDFFGLPDEGFGISMNPTILLSVPDFEDAQFYLKERIKKIKVKMKY